MGGSAVTAGLARWIARRDDVPSPRARRAATHAVLDWVGVTLAGARDPLVDLLIEEAGDGAAVLIGRRALVPAAAAARINGAASHVLDFDDINKRMRGHPTVAILPAVFAARPDATGTQVIDALITATEVACVLGEMLGEEHYLHGFHTTATVGTVTAAAGVCRLRDLDEAKTRRALSIAATQAAGLRAMFGTMVKPLHAGLAAERGFMATNWAALGMSAPDDGIEHTQGLGPVLSPGFAPRPIRPDTGAPFGIEGNVFKRHAACYYTHSPIEAVAGLCRTHDLSADQIARVTIGLQPGLQSVCDIKAPQTGLEVKFSVRHLVAMVLDGRDTSDPAVFDDALVQDTALMTLRDRVDVVPFETDNRMEVQAVLHLTDGRDLRATCDVSTPACDLDAQEQDLTQKFTWLAQPFLGKAAADMAKRLLGMDSAAPMATLLADLTAEKRS